MLAYHIKLKFYKMFLIYEAADVNEKGYHPGLTLRSLKEHYGWYYGLFSRDHR